MKGVVFDIKRFAIHDGPGIRTTLFLKGCPLRCWWCHNPESQGTQPEIALKKVQLDGKSFETNELIGKLMTVNEIMAVIDKEAVFYDESGGGVTLSGGEPLMQTEFALNLLRACKEKGYHTIVDTCGHVATTKLKQVIDFTDLFLYDLKHLDGNEHKKFTGADNSLILENLKFLVQQKKKVIIRIPVIPGINNQEDHLRRIFVFLEEIGGISEVHLLPFHAMASGKYARFQKENKLTGLKDMKKEDLASVTKLFENGGFTVKIGG